MLDVAGTLSNGPDLADIQTHWASSGTSGPLLLISFLQDGTGRLNFANDALFGEHSRELHDFTWHSNPGNKITIEIAEADSVEFTLTSVQGSATSGSMSALVEDDEQSLFSLSFTLATGPPPCC